MSASVKATLEMNKKQLHELEEREVELSHEKKEHDESRETREK